jgi:hypothetical protein
MNREHVAEFVAGLGIDIQQLMLLPVCVAVTVPASVPTDISRMSQEPKRISSGINCVHVVNTNACRCPLTSNAIRASAEELGLTRRKDVLLS